MLKKLVQKTLRAFNLEIHQIKPTARLNLSDIAPEDQAIITQVQPYTMVGAERLYAVIQTVRYIVQAGIAGDLVECGVWRGGCSMAAALTLLQLRQADRQLWLFDTFEGMSKPTAADVSYHGEDAQHVFELKKQADDRADWCYAALADVQANLAQTGYPAANLHFIKGKVEETLPRHAPTHIASLRLDTDWYESIYHSLTHLYPLLSPRGVLLLDDYGHWLGARKAVDTYLAQHAIALLLTRVDYTGRVAIKP